MEYLYEVIFMKPITMYNKYTLIKFYLKRKRRRNWDRDVDSCVWGRDNVRSWRYRPLHTLNKPVLWADRWEYPCRLMHLNTWSLVRGAVWMRFRKYGLLGGHVSPRMGVPRHGLRGLQAPCHSQGSCFLLHLCDPGCKVLATSSAAATCCHAVLTLWTHTQEP